jgi:phenylpropionate dioxygenase-like ring-hydroxylating dioxygenase large terminal subunit
MCRVGVVHLERVFVHAMQPSTPPRASCCACTRAQLSVCVLWPLVEMLLLLVLMWLLTPEALHAG